MDANNTVFWFSVVVSVCVVIWAILAIRAYDKVDRSALCRNGLQPPYRVDHGNDIRRFPATDPGGQSVLAALCHGHCRGRAAVYHYFFLSGAATIRTGYSRQEEKRWIGYKPHQSIKRLHHRLAS